MNLCIHCFLYKVVVYDIEAENVVYNIEAEIHLEIKNIESLNEDHDFKMFYF